MSQVPAQPGAPTRPTIAIVTSCWCYGKYLAEWAKSILALTRKPDQVVIWCHGNVAEDAQAGAAAVAALERAGIRALFHMHGQQVDFGTARNAAVALSETEWVMHLDADDTLMPHALVDWAALVDRADVVCFGYERSGDLRTGPRHRTKLYQTTQGPSTLASPAPCSGVSPFRRAFWERAPYRTDLIGGWDTALWLGFAHRDARFVPTTRPCFWYRQHADSIFNRRRISEWPAHRAGTALQTIRRGHDGVSILVPRSHGDGPDRTLAWAWLRRRYQQQFPEWQILEGFSDGPWIKGSAIQQAVSNSRSRVLVIADADCVIPPDALRQAVTRVESGAAWVVPHRSIYRLNPNQTAEWLALDPTMWRSPPTTELDRPPYPGFPGGGIVVVSRAGYLATGGIPTVFAGWGGEDQVLGFILDTLLGKHERLTADLVHLYHAPQPTKVKQLGHGNRQLWQRYHQALGNVDAMWRLVRTPPHPNAPLTIPEQQAAIRERRERARARLARR